MLKHGVIGMECKWDKSLKTTGFVLQRAQLHQVVDAVFVVFYVSVEHGGVGFQPNLMGRARSVQPLIAINLVVADDVTHTISKNLGASTGERIHSGGFQLLQGL